MPHFEGYGIVTLDFRTFLGKMSDCPQKMSGGERAERCAHPPPRRRRRFGASAGIFSVF